MNPKKTRKPLDETLASDFVYGESKSTYEAPEIDEQPPAPQIAEIESISATAAEPNRKLSLMDKLQVQSKEATKRFTVDLEESLHRKLSILAARTGRSKADIIRMVLDDVLKDVEE